ncbi:YciI family protein [Nocardia suismassiliense]|uniref:YciI family protein n=1 Tax=Nocardia suismassiliense TaxID=2077092 RepID=A0ABW6QVK3_9NOCA
MHYFATIVSGEADRGNKPGTPEFAAGVEKYAVFQEQAAAAIAGGAALFPVDTAINVRREGDQLLVTDGPFTEQSEVVGGFYVFDCPDLDTAVELAGRIPTAARGSVEVRPMVMWTPHSQPGADWWTALLWESDVIEPDTPEWAAAVVEHERFGEQVGDVIRGGGALRPPATAVTVRLRDGQLLRTDGPYTEGAEVVDGVYVFTAAGPAQAAEIATKIPRGAKGRTEVRRIVDVGF